jgi:hypothetical protein
LSRETWVAQYPKAVLVSMAWNRPIKSSMDMVIESFRFLSESTQYPVRRDRGFALSCELFALATYVITYRPKSEEDKLQARQQFNTVYSSFLNFLTNTDSQIQALGLKVLNRLMEELVNRILFVHKLMVVPGMSSDLVAEISSYHLSNKYLGTILSDYDRKELKACESVCENLYLRLLKHLKQASSMLPAENKAIINQAIAVIEACWKLPTLVVAHSSTFFAHVDPDSDSRARDPKRGRDAEGSDVTIKFKQTRSEMTY